MNTVFALHTQNCSGLVQTGSATSVNAHETVPSGMVPRGMVAPDQSRMFPLMHVNLTIHNESIFYNNTPVCLCVCMFVWNRLRNGASNDHQTHYVPLC